MEGKSSNSGSGIPLNPTTILAFLTLAASVLLVSQKLSSDRPLSAAELSHGTIGDQTIDTRLWEDPFLVWEQPPNGLRPLPTNAIPLQEQIRLRAHTDRAPVLLPVMVSGGPYTEDREARIRTRFAVVSALGQSGYAPEDAQHIGAVQLPWPSTAQLQRNQATARNFDEVSTSAAASALRLNYEWYRRRDFAPGSLSHDAPDSVLALWLDEDQFDDYPLLRLALLLEPLLRTTSGDQTNLTGDVALLGPGRSATLRAMLPNFEGGSPPSEFRPNPVLWSRITNVLQQVRLFMATASAMDEVLVSGTDLPAPRAAVLQRLTNGLFKAAANFCVTDSQLAGEALDELSLRGVDLANPMNHLVLISEWDTFYGRMLSLTYAAQLAAFQSRSLSRAQFVENYRKGDPVWPTNLHSFVYLRGLDGQTSARDPDNPSGAGNSADSPASAGNGPIQALRHWSPAANKPEGRAQFDYLARLGERISRLDRELCRNRQGTVGAIGIVGSDIYDTLLILQALRRRFPEAIFFSTDLDARLWDQSEWQWARNLVVVSGYGLQLHPNLQREIPPFRDSQQTAQFAAALAALGAQPPVPVAAVSPRRFEIGRFGPVDFSRTNVAALHPMPSGMRGTPLPHSRIVVACLLALLFALILATLVFRPWIHLTRERRQYEAESLWLREEDLGGLEGFRLVQKQLSRPTDPLTRWLAQEHGHWPVQQGSTELWPVRHEQAGEPGVDQKMAALLEDEDAMQRFLDFLNGSLQRNNWVPLHILDETHILASETKHRYRDWAEQATQATPFLVRNTLGALQHNRRLADELLDWLLRVEAAVGDSKIARKNASRADAAASARQAGWQKHRLRRGRLQGFWISVGIFTPAVFALAISAWRDTYASTVGEHFSLTAGVSAWPTECLRFAALVLTAAFVAESYATLRTTALDLTRKYRLKFARTLGPATWWLPTTPVPEAVVQADQLWERYQQMGFWRNRFCRIILPLVAYIGFAACLNFLGTTPHRPLRGHAIFLWDNWLLALAVLAFLFLTFWTMDAARLCRWFTEHLSEAPSRYPKATREYFSALRGGTPGHLLDEWIDLHLIAELTERVGRLIYFPFIVFFLLLVSRNQWWDLWPWSAGLVVIFVLNLMLAAGGLIILQRAALNARERAMASLRTKVDSLREAAAVTEPQKAQATLGQAEKLLEEIRELDTGAFAGFWDNPLLGALLVPSGGTAIIEMAQYFLAR